MNALVHNHCRMLITAQPSATRSLQLLQNSTDRQITSAQAVGDTDGIASGRILAPGTSVHLGGSKSEEDLSSVDIKMARRCEPSRRKESARHPHAFGPFTRRRDAGLLVPTAHGHGRVYLPSLPRKRVNAAPIPN